MQISRTHIHSRHLPIEVPDRPVDEAQAAYSKAAQGDQNSADTA